MISLAKFRVLLILNHLLDGFEPHEYVFYLYRRELDPHDFRLNLAYQHYFFHSEYNGEYKTEMFFTYYKNINVRDKSPFLIEIGFECYFLLKKMEENFRLDYDEQYHNKIIKLLPKWDKPQIKVNHNIFIESLTFLRDIFLAFVGLFYRSNKRIDTAEVARICENDYQIKNILNFYENRSAQIEVLMDGELQEFYFPRLPYCSFQNTEAKDDFLDKVNRTNSKTKCENLVRESKVLLVVLKIDYWLRTRLGRFFGLFIKYLELCKNYLQIISLVINIIVIISYNDLHGGRDDKPQIDSDFDEDATIGLIFTLGAINLFLAVIVVGVQLSLRIPYNIQKFRVREADAKKRQKDSESGYQSETTKMVNKVYSFYNATVMIFSDIQVTYHILYLVFSILALAYHPYFYCFLLSYLIVRSAVLINVLKAVYGPKKQIALSIFLLIVVTYWFSIIAYSAFHSDYNESIENSCYSLWSCLTVTLDQSYKNDGAIGGFLSPPFNTKSSKITVEWDRFFFDYMFNLIVAILLTEILSGIIIDKFGELREENEEKLKDSQSECFICGQSREDLEKELGYEGFRYHTLFEHNMWDYLFFIGYVKHKKNSYVNDYIEIERYVFESLDRNDNTWMPCYYDYEAEEEEEQQGFKDDDRILLQQILVDLKTIKMGMIAH